MGKSGSGVGGTHERRRHGQKEIHTWLIRRTALDPDKDMNVSFLTLPVFTGNALRHAPT